MHWPKTKHKTKVRRVSDRLLPACAGVAARARLTAHSRMSTRKRDKDAERLTRIAIVSDDRCKPKKCRQECKRSCPVVRMGLLFPDSNFVLHQNKKQRPKVSFVSKLLQQIASPLYLRSCALAAAFV